MTIALTAAGKWALISAPTLLSEAPTIIDDAGGAIALLVYKNGVFVIPSEEDMNLILLTLSMSKQPTQGKSVLSSPPLVIQPMQASNWLPAGTWSEQTMHGLAENEFATIQPEDGNALMSPTLIIPERILVIHLGG